MSIEKTCECRPSQAQDQPRCLLCPRLPGTRHLRELPLYCSAYLGTSQNMGACPSEFIPQGVVTTRTEDLATHP